MRQKLITQKMTDQEWSDFYVVFTIISCAFQVRKMLVALLFETA